MIAYTEGNSRRGWRLTGALVLAVGLLQGCDNLYGPSRGSKLEKMPDLACIKDGIGQLPGVTDVQYIESKDQNVLDGSGIHPATKVYTFAYHRGGFYLGALAVYKTYKDEYSVGLYRYSFSPPDPDTVKTVETAMDSLSAILADQCGIKIVALVR